MSARTSDWSSSATRILAAALSGICSVLEKRGIDVAAAHDEHRGRHRPDGTGPERSGRGGAGRLDRDMALPPEKMYRLAQCVIFDEDHSRETVALAGEVREGDVPDAERNQPIGEARRALEPHRLARRERAGELRRAGGLDAPHPRRAPGRRESDHDPRDEAAPAHRHHDGADVGKIGGDLEAHGRLPGDDVRVVERRHDREPLPCGELFRLHLAVLRRAPREHHFATPLLHARNLDRRRRFGHDDDRPNAQQLSRVRDRLAMIPARVGDDPRAPCVLRPEIRIPSTGTRIMIPFLVIIMSSSSGSTSLSATMSPVLSDRLSVMIPRPPRCCTRYSSSSERLPMPFSVTVSSVDLRRTTTMSMTWSFLSSSIPFTPVAVRPISRTSFSWNRMLMPCRVASTMSLRPSVTCTSISSSPFSMLMARMPTERGLPNSESRVFFTTPFLVANRRYWSSEHSRWSAPVSVRRWSPEPAASSVSSSFRIFMRRGLEARISLHSLMNFRTSFSSSSSFVISRAVSRASRMLRISADCFSDSLKRLRRLASAVGVSLDFLMMRMTSSMLSTAIFRPSRMCSRSCARFSSKSVRRTMTVWRCSMKC